MSSARDLGIACMARRRPAKGFNKSESRSIDSGSPWGTDAGLLKGRPTEEASVIMVDRPSSIPAQALTTPAGAPCLTARASTTCLLT
eukprot:6643099-Alexandrium_andersonii.AAC.1